MHFGPSPSLARSRHPARPSGQRRISESGVMETPSNTASALNLNMKYLRTFLIQVEERSTQKTARRLGITKPAVLAHISAVEKAAGQRLFERGSSLVNGQIGRTQLTEAGRVFLPKAIKAMSMHDLMFADDPWVRDPREDSRVIAMRFVEMALAALRHDLSEGDRERLYNSLLN